MKNNKDHFPPFIELLLNKGVKLLSKQEQEQARAFLENNDDLASNPEIVYALLRLYNGLEMFSQAKKIGKAFLKTNGYQKKILAELSISYLHTDKMEHYFAIVNQFTVDEKKKNLSEREGDNVVSFPKQDSFFENSNDFFNWQISEQLTFLKQIQFKKITPYIDFFIFALKNPNCTPLIKSVIFEMMQKKEIDQTFSINKLGLKGEFNPKFVLPISEQRFPKALLAKLNDRLESKNPSILEQLLATIKHHLFALYPFTLKPEEEEFWMDAYLIWISELYEFDLYGSKNRKTKHLETAVLFIKRIEISSQNYF